MNDVSTKTLQSRFRLNSKFLHFEANVVITLLFFLYLLSFFLMLHELLGICKWNLLFVCCTY